MLQSLRMAVNLAHIAYYDFYRSLVMFEYLSLYFPFVKIRSLETLPSGERP